MCAVWFQVIELLLNFEPLSLRLDLKIIAETCVLSIKKLDFSNGKVRIYVIMSPLLSIPIIQHTCLAVGVVAL